MASHTRTGPLAACAGAAFRTDHAGRALSFWVSDPAMPWGYRAAAMGQSR